MNFSHFKLEVNFRFIINKLLKAQLTEEKSNYDSLKRRESEYLNEINDIKTSKRRLVFEVFGGSFLLSEKSIKNIFFICFRIEDSLIELQSKLEKFHRNDNEKVLFISSFKCSKY